MNILDVVKKKKCIGCGVCATTCPYNVIKMSYMDKEGFYRPLLKKASCINCGLCSKVCPADNECLEGSFIGPYKEIFLAHAFDDNVRNKATSGGVVNSLIRYLLVEGYVEAALMVVCDNNIIGASTKFFETKDVHMLENAPRMFSSRYVALPVLEKLSKHDYKRIAVVGTPCQMIALTKYSQIFKATKIIKIGIACSGGISFKATEEYKKKQQAVDALMYYRGDGWPGKNSLILKDKNIEYKHLGSMFERMFSSQIFKNPGCRKCYDQFAELADISFCDFWNNSELEHEMKGNSCVIIRNSKLKCLIDDMIKKHYIEIVRTLSEEETIKSQSLVLKSKKNKFYHTVYGKFFSLIIDVVFKLKIYRMFDIKQYDFFCKLYNKLLKSHK